MTLRPLVISIALVIGCSDPSDAVEADLAQRVDEVDEIFHFGCTECDGFGGECPAAGADPEPFQIRCGDGRWRCGDDAIDALREEWTTQPHPVTLSWLSPDTLIVGRFFDFWFVDADGNGIHFFEERNDTDDGCGGGSYCGFHREEVADLIAADGTPRITHAGETISELSACDDVQDF